MLLGYLWIFRGTFIRRQENAYPAHRAHFPGSTSTNPVCYPGLFSPLGQMLTLGNMKDQQLEIRKQEPRLWRAGHGPLPDSLLCIPEVVSLPGPALHPGGWAGSLPFQDSQDYTSFGG